MDISLESYSDDDSRNITGFVVFYIFIVIAFVAIAPRVFSSAWVSSSDFHACIEICSSFIAFIAAIACLIYYFGLKSRYFLIIGLGFFICGSEDFIHGIISFERLFKGSGVDFTRFIPGTYVAGRSLLAISIIIAALLEPKLKETKNYKREAFVFSTFAIIIGVGITALAFSIPLPQFIHPDSLISRPVDFISSILFLVAFILIMKRYLLKKDIFSGMILACILLNIGAQVYMSFSKQLYDIFFDTAHWANILSYCTPMVGITIQLLQEMRRTNREVTEHKRAEGELKETKDHLDNVIESSLDGIVVGDSTGNITKANAIFLKMIDYTEEEIKGMHVMELSIKEKGIYESTTGDKVEIDEKHFNNAKEIIYEKLFKEGKITNWETYYLRKDKKIVPVEMTVSFLYSEGGDIVGSVGINRDITERKKHEKELKMSEEKYRSLIENANDAIISANEEGKIVGFNKKAEEIFGYTSEEVLGKPPFMLADPSREESSREKLAEFIRKRKTGLMSDISEKKGLTKDGTLVPIESYVYTIEVEGKFIITAIIREISERKKAEKEIREGKDFLENVIKSSRDGIVITDEREQIIVTNTAIEEMSGYRKEELVGVHPSLFLPIGGRISDATMGKILEMYEEGSALHELRLKTKGGDLINVECGFSAISDNKGNNIGVVSIVRDVTERKEMEHKLLQSEKLKSLGELAGGVAHDFNNVLAAILGRAQLLKMIFESPPGKEERRSSMIELKESLDVIEQASRDGAETVRRIQEFARRRDDDKHFTTVDLNEIIESSIDYTKTKWKNYAESKGIKFNIKKEFSTLPTTSGCASELREVFTNLINNACDAMPQGGEIKFKTYRENSHIVINVEDTGAGIPKALRNKIFDPFFTTKGVHSTGLGMSVSYGIINRHRGTISVDSVEEAGTTFTIILPIFKNAAQEEKATHFKGEPKKARIMIIEDEEHVRNLLAAILKKKGHEVEVVSDGNQGIEMFEKKEFDIVFTDLGMPGMSGWQVAEKVKGINGRVPVVLITGWDIKKEATENENNWVDLIIHKPFEVDQVLNVVQEGMILRERFKAI